jgi:hypothetical protein
MAFFAIAVAVVLYFEKFHSLLLNKDVSKVYFYTIFVVLLSSVTFYSVIEVARDDVKTYYLQDNSKDSSTARRAFLNNLPDVLEGKYIFLGRGLASYGSPASGRYYSSLYYDLGMNRVHGMSKDRPMFVNDAYYAMFFGQLGIAGLIFQVFFWCYMLSPFWICFRSKANIPKTYMIVSVLSVAWSFIFIAGSGLFNSQGSFIMCALGLARGHLKVMLKNENRASVFNQQSVQYRTIA